MSVFLHGHVCMACHVPGHPRDGLPTCLAAHVTVHPRAWPVCVGIEHQRASQRCALAR